MSYISKFRIQSTSVKNLIIYFGFDGINKVLPFIIIPIIARYITTAEYGLVTNFLILVQILYAFCTLNNFSALSVNYFKQTNNISEYFSNIVYFSLLLGSICFILVLGFSHYINEYLRLSLSIQVLALITAMATAVFSLFTTLLRMKKEAVKFGIFQSSQSILFFILVLIFVILLSWGWKGRIFAQVVSSLFICIICVFFLQKMTIQWRKLNFIQQKQLFSWGIPLLPYSLSFWFKSGTDKIIITNLLSLSANGIYSVALTLGGIISLFTTSFFNMYSPVINEKLTQHEQTEDNRIKEKIENYIVRNIYLFVLGLGVICFLSYFILKFIINSFLRGDYLLSVSLLHLVLIGGFFNGIYLIISVFLFYKNKTKFLGSITFSLAIIQIFMTYVGVQFFGLKGALYASILSSSVLVLLIFLYANRLYNLPWIRTMETLTKRKL